MIDERLREFERRARNTEDEIDILRWAREYLRIKEPTPQCQIKMS